MRFDLADLSLFRDVVEAGSSEELLGGMGSARGEEHAVAGPGTGRRGTAYGCAEKRVGQVQPSLWRRSELVIRSRVASRED